MIKCPHCQNEDMRAIERVRAWGGESLQSKYLCNICSKTFELEEVKSDKSENDFTNRPTLTEKISRPRRR